MLAYTRPWGRAIPRGMDDDTRRRLAVLEAFRRLGLRVVVSPSGEVTQDDDEPVTKVDRPSKLPPK